MHTVLHSYLRGYHQPLRPNPEFRARQTLRRNEEARKYSVVCLNKRTPYTRQLTLTLDHAKPKRRADTGDRHYDGPRVDQVANPTPAVIADERVKA